MRKGWFGTIGLAVLFCAMSGLAGPTAARAEVSVSINIGPPPIVVAEPPAVVLVPRTQVYYVPDPDIDVFFYGGYWWSPRGDRWYRAKAYNGPWRVIERRYVPRQVHRVPRDYRVRYEKERHIPYGQWKKEHRKGGHGEGKRRDKDQGGRHGDEGGRERGHGRD